MIDEHRIADPGHGTTHDWNSTSQKLSAFFKETVKQHGILQYAND
jgi:hypothetical protein